MNSNGHTSIWPKYGHGALGTALVALGLSGLDLTARTLERASDQRNVSRGCGWCWWSRLSESNR